MSLFVVFDTNVIVHYITKKYLLNTEKFFIEQSSTCTPR